MSEPASSAPTNVTRKGDDPIVSARAFSKSFGGKRVLDNVDLELRSQEVHALLGENGSGKSTFIKILAGYHAPDPGAKLLVRGQQKQLPLRPGEFRRLGIAFVHQDLGLIDSATVAENLRVGRFDTSFGWRIRWRKERRSVQEALERFGLKCRANTPVASLREVERALVAVLRALDELRSAGQGGVLVLDEPTSYLPSDGVERLFTATREAANGGVAVLLVTHNLEEVQSIADHVSVLRNGRLVHTGPARALTQEQLVEHILGFTLDEMYPERRSEDSGGVICSVRGASSALVDGFNLDIHRGEVVGLTGLLGMGWEHVPYILFGAEAAFGGEMKFGDKTYDLRRFSPQAAVACGLALVPANRLRDGGSPIATVTENLTLPTLRRHFARGYLNHRGEAGAVIRLMNGFDIRPRDPHLPFGSLSGGNQQKVVLAKWLEAKPTVLLMHEPTHGVDVGAKRQILQVVQSAAADGAACIVASSEYEELASVCDRVLVFRDGRVVAELADSELTANRIGERALRGAHV